MLIDTLIDLAVIIYDLQEGLHLVVQVFLFHMKSGSLFGKSPGLILKVLMPDP
jgi:hypothetical protein